MLFAYFKKYFFKYQFKHDTAYKHIFFAYSLTSNNTEYSHWAFLLLLFLQRSRLINRNQLIINKYVYTETWAVLWATDSRDVGLIRWRLPAFIVWCTAEFVSACGKRHKFAQVGRGLILWNPITLGPLLHYIRLLNQQSWPVNHLTFLESIKSPQW